MRRVHSLSAAQVFRLSKNLRQTCRRLNERGRIVAAEVDLEVILGRHQFTGTGDRDLDHMSIENEDVVVIVIIIM